MDNRRISLPVGKPPVQTTLLTLIWIAGFRTLNYLGHSKDFTNGRNIYKPELQRFIIIIIIVKD